MVSSKMKKQNIVIYQAKDDCNTLIVRTAINLVKSLNYPVVVVAQETDILVLIYYHQPSSSSNLYLQSDLYDLYDISSIDISDREEFICKYGWSGNDTVFCIHGHTQCAIYKYKFPSNIFSAFTDLTLPENTIRTAGSKAMQITYGCGDIPLDKYQYIQFQKQE